MTVAARTPEVESPAATVGRLTRRIRGYGFQRAVVAFSGGVDSSVVLALAALALGPARVEAVTAVSPSYPDGELAAARRVADGLGVPHRAVQTQEVEREAYARNDAMRCFHCKTELYGTLHRLMGTGVGGAEHGRPDRVVLAGANADDVDDVRPGLRAADQQGVRNPLLEEGVGKLIVRAVARHLGLAVADKPALACLSSRVARDIRVTPELLGRIDAAEQAVRGLGFEQVRVRHFGDAAVVEVAPEQVPGLMAHPKLQNLAARLRTLGWQQVSVDPLGYRMGRMNPPP